MALPGNITISKNASASAAVATAFTAIGGTLIFDVDDKNCLRKPQASTVSSSLSPERSQYGTIQNPAYPPTKTPKYLWIFTGVFLTAPQFKALELLQLDNTATALSCTLIDNFWHTLIYGSSLTTTVRLFFNNGELMDGGCYHDRINGVNVIPCSFTAIEL